MSKVIDLTADCQRTYPLDPKTSDQVPLPDISSSFLADSSDHLSSAFGGSGGGVKDSVDTGTQGWI